MISRYMDDVVSQVVDNIAATLKGIEQTTTHFSYGPLIGKFMEPENDFALYGVWNYQDNMVRTAVETNPNISDIAFFRTDGHIRYQYDQTNVSTREILDRYEKDVLSAHGIDGFVCLTDETGKEKRSGYVKRIFHLASSAKYGKLLGACIVLLDSEILSRMVQRKPTIGDSDFFLLDKDYKLISGTRDELPDLKAFRALPGVFTRNVGDTGWTLIARVDADTLFDNYRVVQQFSIIVTVLILGLLGLQLQIFNRNIITPISHLHEEITNVIASRFTDRITMPTKGEIGGIAKSVNLMLDHHSKMEEQVLRTQQNLWETQLESKQNELAALENQVNPHFLMNTLQCICGIAVANDVPMIIDVTSSLRSIFDYSLHGSDEVTLSEELNCVREYFSIINIRFDRAYSLSIDVPEELQGQRLCRMVLQPLAENAVYHGLEKKGSGTLSISAWRENDTVTIRMIDDGVGIEKEPLSRLQSMLADSTLIHRESIEHKRIGIANTCRRIKMMFGDQYGLSLESVAEEGTRIEIRVPHRIKG